MTRRPCTWCGEWLEITSEHEKQCRAEYQARVNERGMRITREALARAKEVADGADSEGAAPQ